MAGGKQRVYRQRIRATQTLQKVFRAMETMAASRIGPARSQATELGPYQRALTQAVAALAVHSELHHPLTDERRDTQRVAVLAVGSDRGLAGAYTATILRETDRLLARLREQGDEPVLYTSGRRAEQYFRFRHVSIEHAWRGESDSPSVKRTREISGELLQRFLDPDPARGVRAVYLVFTRFHSMIRQSPEVRQMLPLTVVDAPSADKRRAEEAGTAVVDASAPVANVVPEYEFIPSGQAVLDALLPLYVDSRIRNALLQAAVSELSARQRAMQSATDNAKDLIDQYTRLANSARQADITQEISEIVAGADALTRG